MNIPELKDKIKSIMERLNSKEVYTVLLILIVGFGSFGLGRLSGLQKSKLPIRLEGALSETAAVAVSSGRIEGDRKAPASLPGVENDQAETNNSLASGGLLVASKSGSKYHFPWCAGAKAIADKNKIWFKSAEEAKSAGYTPASNCKGLK